MHDKIKQDVSTVIADLERLRSSDLGVVSRELPVLVSRASDIVDPGSRYLFNSSSRIAMIVLALLFFGYALYGFLMNDIIIPSRRGGQGIHFSGNGALMIFGSFTCFSGFIVTASFSKFDIHKIELGNKSLRYVLGIAAVIFLFAGIYFNLYKI